MDKQRVIHGSRSTGQSPRSQPKDRLYWVHHNRTRRDRVRAAGALLNELLNGAAGDTGVRLARIRENLEPVVDADFLRHCRLAGIRSDALIVGVDSPGLVHVMRLRWEATVQAVARRLTAGVSRVTFVYVEPAAAGRRRRA